MWPPVTRGQHTHRPAGASRGLGNLSRVELDLHWQLTPRTLAARCVRKSPGLSFPPARCKGPSPVAPKAWASRCATSQCLAVANSVWNRFALGRREKRHERLVGGVLLLAVLLADLVDVVNVVLFDFKRVHDLKQ